MIVVVIAGEQEQHRNARRIEAGVIAGASATRICAHRETATLDRRTDELVELLRGAGAAHRQLVTTQTTHHVKVDHGGDLVRGHGRVLHELAAAIESALLGGEGEEDDAATIRGRFLGVVEIVHGARAAQHGAGAAGVVVGAWMQLAAVLRIGAEVAHAHVVVVTADDHPLIRQLALATQHATHVLRGNALLGDRDLDARLHIGLQRDALHLALVRHLAEVHQAATLRIGLAKQRVGGFR